MGKKSRKNRLKVRDDSSASEEDTRTRSRSPCRGRDVSGDSDNESVSESLNGRLQERLDACRQGGGVRLLPAQVPGRLVEEMDGVEEMTRKRANDDDNEGQARRTKVKKTMVSKNEVLNTCANVDRVKGGLKELYVVCQDLSEGPRKIKKEANEIELRASPSDCNASVDTLARIQAISRDLRGMLFNDANKITKWAAERVLNYTSKYEDVVQRLLLENARLSGRIEERERMFVKMSESVNKIEENVERINGICEKVADAPLAKGANAVPRNASVKRSYAVIVRGEKEDLTAEEVKKRMSESVCNDVDVRVRAVKPVRGGGVVVETASDRDRRLLADCPNFSSVGLKVAEPKRLDPRVVVYDVPNDMTDERLLGGMREKSFAGMSQEYLSRVRVVSRPARGGTRVGNAIIELPFACRERLLREGRTYIGWSSFKVSAWERVSRCFSCMSYGHRAAECKSRRLCWTCGKPGHDAATCRAPAECGNCRARKLPSAHSAVSRSCPEYERRLALLRSRLHNG